MLVSTNFEQSIGGFGLVFAITSTLYFSHYLASLGVAVERRLDCCFVATP